MSRLQTQWILMRQIGPEGLISPDGPTGEEASDMTLTALLRRLYIPPVPHGFRSSFRN